MNTLIAQSPAHITLVVNHALRSNMQEQISQSYNNGDPITAAHIARLAQSEHEQYPQYAGHWCGAEWVLVQVKRQVMTGLGIAFEAGDITIGKRCYIMGDWTVYSIRNGVDTRVSLGVQSMLSNLQVVKHDSKYTECK